MAEFLTMEDAENKFGKKGRTNAGLTLGIIGTALAALGNNGNGCGCGNNGGILGGLFGGNNGGCCAMQQAEQAKTMAMVQGEASQNLAWANRVQSMQDDIDLYTYINAADTSLRNQNYEGRIVDQREKCNMYIDLLSRDNAQNVGMATALANAREKDVTEKADIFERLSTRINELEKKEVATQTALPLMFELAKVNAERYSDDCCCKTQKEMLVMGSELQRQLDHKITGELKYSYSNLCAPVPSISPLYCSPFTQYGTGMYAGAAASNWNAVNAAIGSTCPSCQAQ